MGTQHNSSLYLNFGINSFCTTYLSIFAIIWRNKRYRIRNDASILRDGSAIPKNLNIQGTDANSMYFALNFLEKSNMYIEKDFEKLSIWIEIILEYVV